MTDAERIDHLLEVLAALVHNPTTYNYNRAEAALRNHGFREDAHDDHRRSSKAAG